jgi:hypothetical protein
MATAVFTNHELRPNSRDEFNGDHTPENAASRENDFSGPGGRRLRLAVFNHLGSLFG